MLDIATPPAEYRHAPEMPATIWIQEPAQVAEKCRKMGVTGQFIYGCQFWLGGQCFALVAAIPGWIQILLHEVAHCNGWKHELRMKE